MTEHTHTAMIKAGTILLLSHGAYSDYRVAGIVRALVDVDMVQELEAWLAAHPELTHRHPVTKALYIDGDAFGHAVYASDKFEQLPYEEYHMGDYGELPYWYKEAKGLLTDYEKEYGYADPNM